MNKVLFFWIVISISIALATEAEALGDVETQVAVVRSDAKAKTISEPARQTTVRSADIDTIKKLAAQLSNRKDIATSKTSWNEWTAALASAKALIEQQPAGEMHVFEPLFEPLFSKVGWGGIIRRESRTAADLLVRIGKPAVVFLLEKLKSAEARQRCSAIQILTEISEPDAPIVSAIRPLLSDKDDYVRRVAIESLGKLGENARPAAEDLKDAFNDTSAINRIFARAAYIRMGHSKPEHIRAIAKYLESHDTKDGAGYGSAAAVAASVLGDLGPAAIIAAPDLTTALNHPQSQIRLNATHALGCIGADSNQAIDALIDRLKNDTSRQVRRSAATSLGRIGPKAQDAIPVLAKVLREADKESRNDKKTDRTGWWVAVRAVGQIGGANAIPVLEESLKNNDPDIRGTAAKALEKIQQEAKTPATPGGTQPMENIGELTRANTAAKVMESLPAQNSFRGTTVSISANKSVYEPGSILEIVGTISTDRENTMYNAYWDLKKPVPGRLFVYDEAGNKILEFYDPRHHIGSSTGATKSACRKYRPGETQQIFLRQYLLFNRSADRPLPAGHYKVQLALNGLLLWKPQEYVAHNEVPKDLDQQMVVYSNVVDIEVVSKDRKNRMPKPKPDANEKQLAWLVSEADLVVVAESPWQYDRLYAKQVLKGSKVSFSKIQEIDGIEKPPTDKNRQWILFLRIEQDHNLLLSPLTPSGWFAPYSEELAQRVLAAIPQPENWGETEDGLRMGLRLRKSHFYVGEDIPVEIHIQNVDQKNITLYQHRYNNREYDYYPFTRFVVEFSDGRRIELYKPALLFSDMDSPSPRTLSPGKTYIHTVDLNEWTDWRQPLPKPGEKAELFTAGMFKITCTYSVEKNPPMVPEPAQPQNAWSGTLISSPNEFRVIQAGGTIRATQQTVTERYVLNDMTVDVRKEVERLYSQDAKIRALAAMALGEMGHKARPAIPHLIRLLGDQAKFDHRDIWQKATFFTVRGHSSGAYVAAEATGALAKIGKPAVELLIAALKDSNAFVRVHAARALERIQDKQAVEPLCEVLKDANENVRSAAAIALGQLGDGRAAKPLTDLLADKALQPRQDAIDALAKLGKPATKSVLIALRDWQRREYASYVLAKTRDPGAVEPLIEDLNDPNHNVRQGAALGLGALGNRRAIKPLVKLLKDPNPHVRANAIQSLGRVGGIPIEVYKTALQDKESEVRCNAILALKRMKDPNTTDIIVDALMDKDSRVRNHALLAVSDMQDCRVVPALIKVLRDDKDETMQINAAGILGRFKDKRAVQPLIKALRGKNYLVRARASYALGEIKDPQAVDVLCKALHDEKPEVRVRATMALRNIRDKRAVGPLIEALKDPDWEVVIRTAEALGKIGDTRAVEPLISILMEELKSPRKINIVRDCIREGTDDLPWAGTTMTVALPVIRALGWIGDERATQPLLTALKDRRFQIRDEAAQALGNIGAQAAVTVMIAALKDDVSSVRCSAARALGQIKDPCAIEPLIAVSRDKEVSAYAISALRSITGHPDYTWEQWQRWWKKNGDKWMRSATRSVKTDRPAWANAVTRALPGWEIIQCDQQPTISVDTHKGYRLLLRKSRKEYLDPPQRQLPPDHPIMKKLKFVIKYSHVDLVLFPSNKDLPADIKENIPWDDVEQQHFVKSVNMGQGMGFTWFGRTTISLHEDLRQKLGLKGGDDRLRLLTEGLGIVDGTASAVAEHLARFGDKAIPNIQDALRRYDGKYPEYGYAVSALAQIPGKQSTEILRSLYASDKTRDSAALALIYEPYRKAAKKEYLDMVRRQQYLLEATEACVEFQWKEAIPILQKICDEPSPWDSFSVAFKAKRELQGQPIPRDVEEAGQFLRKLVYLRTPPSQESIQRAKKTILDSADREVAAVIATNLAIFDVKAPSNRIKVVNEVGWEILRTLPEKTVSEVLEHVIHGFREEYQQSARRKFRNLLDSRNAPRPVPTP